MSRSRGGATILLVVAGMLVIAAAAGFYTLYSHPELVTALRNDTLAQPANKTSTDVLGRIGTPTMIYTLENVTKASPNAQQASASGSNATNQSNSTKTATPTPTPVINYTYPCESTSDCHKFMGNCTSYLSPSAPGTKVCAACSCICQEKQCISTVTPTPLPTLKAVTVTPTPSASKGNGMILVYASIFDADIYLDGSYKLRVTANASAPLLRIAPGTYDLLSISSNCTKHYTVTVKADESVSLSVC